jgi:valyl-tRNA synthetase
MKPLPKNYEHKEREKHWQRVCEKTFVIDTPPPTVSGLLHMGHIFSYTQADFVARYQRMSGKDVFYPMGFDDNGLPTERLVEKIKGVRGTGMPRAEFVALCKEVVKEAEDEFRALFKSTALSVDWRKEYQTINDDVRALSQASFLDLVAKGHAYRDFRPTYWDWVDQTAIAQAEIENKELPGTMNEIEFTLEDGSPLLIMTTRPELLGACVAVMYHPENANAASYKDKHAIIPLFGVKVPMIADEAVEQGKGTGLVMCCTFGDDTDKEWWRKYNLPLKAILGKDGRLQSEIAKASECKNSGVAASRRKAKKADADDP